MKKYIILIFVMLTCILCISTIIALSNEDSIIVKNLGFDIVGDDSGTFYFTSQSGETLPTLEYKDSIYVPIRSFCRYVDREVKWESTDYGTEVIVRPFDDSDYEEFMIYGDEQSIYDYPIVSMIELIAYPEKYDGKNISVSGVINVEYESDGLFLTKEDYEYYIAENSISWQWWELEFLPEMTNEREFYYNMGNISGKHVEMAGTFNATEVSKVGLGARGYLTDVKYIRCYK